MRRILLALFLMVVLSQPVIAETYSQNSDVTISHPIRVDGAIDSTLLANVSIRNPTGLFLISSDPMTYNSSTEEHEYFLDGNNVTTIGNYPYCITATGGGLSETTCFEFEITPSGFTRISTGEGIVLFSGLLMIFSIGIFAFFLFLKAETTTGKFTLISVAGIFILMSVLFSTVLIQQNLGGFGNIISGYETFVFVTKAVVSIALVAFFVTVLLVMLKAWKLRRGVFD